MTIDATPKVSPIIKCMNEDCMVFTRQQANSETMFFVGVSKNDSAIKRMLGNDDVYKLFINAINNRTRERNYFRLYSDLLSGVISEDEFNNEIETNEDDYVLTSNEKVNEATLKYALNIAQHVKDVHNSEDLATLFSFNSAETDKCLLEIK